jgi:3-hydroxyisobutyrate dehydrogenase-like beta-hydroxyacid dehydrogenase
MSETGPSAGMIGVGDMGLPMSQHMVKRGLDVAAYDVDASRLAEAAAGGVKPVGSVGELSAQVDVIVACVRTDEQMEGVADEVLAQGREGQLVVVAGTHSLAMMRRLGERFEGSGRRIIDGPVVYGASGAREGVLVSLCGGEAQDVERARPVMMGYSRAVEHVGSLGAGQLAKACNNLMHWIHSIANFETLAIAKRYGVDAQRMREVLLECPAENGTLRRWDGSRFTWQEKDMDFILELAQDGGLMLPLTGQVDQLVKSMSAGDVAALLYGEECSYLGRSISAMSSAEGGL